jgi:trimeric autotransporter adhesin
MRTHNQLRRKQGMFMYGWMLFNLLLINTAGVWAQSSQSPTQTVPIGNEPYLVTPTPGSTYSWTITPGSSGTEWSINGTGNSITADWIIPGVYTLSVVETNGSGCQGLPVSVVVTVNPGPSVDDPLDQALCSGSLTASVNFTGGVPGTVYTWTNNTPSIGLAATGSGNIASFNAVNTGTTPVVAIITVTPSYTNAGNTYTGTPQSFTITVNPLPVTSPIFHN